MKTWSINSVTLLMTCLGAASCAPSEQTLDKRGAKLAELADVGTGNSAPNTGDAAGDAQTSDPGTGDQTSGAVEPTIPELNYPALKLAAAKGLESVPFSDIILTSKVSATEFILFGKDGKSWSYKPDASAAADVLKPIEAVVIPPTGSTLYSLPDQEFWFIAQDKLGRHKPAEAGATTDEKSITVEQFSTKTFQGDLSKMKVLYVSRDEVIFHLDTYIAILNVKTSPAQIKQLPIDKLPVNLSGVVQAGRTDNGYWFKANGSVFLLNATEVEGTSPWSKGTFTVDPGDLTGLAMWPAVDGSKYAGTSLGTSATGFFSDAPVAKDPIK